MSDQNQAKSAKAEELARIQMGGGDKATAYRIEILTEILMKWDEEKLDSALRAFKQIPVPSEP